MSEQPGQTRSCPTCGNTVPVMARYCPSCGTRLDPAAYTSDDFENALADVLDAPVDDAPSESSFPTATTQPPIETQPTVTATPPSQSTEWTARASDWTEPTGQPGTWTAQPPTVTSPARPRGNRTMWILLAILGFIIFCCCGGIFAALLIDGTTSAAGSDVTLMHHLKPV